MRCHIQYEMFLMLSKKHSKIMGQTNKMYYKLSDFNNKLMHIDLIKEKYRII